MAQCCCEFIWLLKSKKHKRPAGNMVSYVAADCSLALAMASSICCLSMSLISNQRLHFGFRGLGLGFHGFWIFLRF